MNKRNKIVKGLVAVASAFGSAVAFAEVPATVTTALTGANADSITVAGSVLAIIVGIFAIKLMRRAL